MTRILVGAVALLGVAAFPPSSAQVASATTDATVDIVAALGITKTADLDFGAVVPTGAQRTVVVSAAGARTCGAGLSCTDTVTAAGFSVTGGNSLGYAITLPASATVTSAGNSMTVDTFTDSEGGTSTLDGTGNDSFTVGATLNVDGGQNAGTYTGTFDVTADYD